MRPLPLRLLRPGREGRPGSPPPVASRLGEALRLLDRVELRAACEAAASRPAARRELLDAVRAAPGSAAVEAARLAAADGPLPAALLAARGVDSPSERADALRLLALLMPADAPARLAPSLRDGDPEVRRAAADALAGCGSVDAARVLVTALLSGALSAEGLVERLGAPWAGSTLVTALTHRAVVGPGETAGPVRVALCQALRRSGHPAAAHVLAAVLRDGAEEERTAAAAELGLLRGPAGADALLVALGDPAAPVRAAAAVALGRLGSEAALASLERQLDDSDKRASSAARRALLAFGVPGRDAVVRARARRDPGLRRDVGGGPRVVSRRVRGERPPAAQRHVLAV